MADETGLRIGSFAGAPIIVDPTVLLLALYVLVTGALAGGGLITAVIFLAALLLAVLLHEFGHAGVAALLRLPSKRIVLTFFGGHVEFDGSLKARWQEIAVSFAGPATNLLTFAICIPILGGAVGWSNNALFFVFQLERISLILGLFNLLPGFPLDGGRILRAALHYFMPLGRARLVAGCCGVLVAIGLASWAYGRQLWWTIIVAVVLALAAWAEIQSARASLARSG
ncbi:MAG TPA: site-2 protease family protein [Caulobacterales bacterium]|nr:site-2 protease family protein [Caulobacterales bacterium]